MYLYGGVIVSLVEVYEEEHYKIHVLDQ